MKLFEIKDITSYRPGDEDDPRSPDYEDPMDGVNVGDYQPEMPAAYVEHAPGKDRHGDDYSFRFIIQWPEGQSDHDDVEYYIATEFHEQFPQYEVVWDENIDVNGHDALVTYLQGDGANDPSVADKMNAVLKTIVQQLADKMANSSAEKDALAQRDSRRNTRRSW